MSPYYSFRSVIKTPKFDFLLDSFKSSFFDFVTSRKLKDLVYYTVIFFHLFHSTFSDLSSKKSVEMLCLDSVLHAGLISLISLNSFEICEWGSCVSALAFSAGVIVTGENSGVLPYLWPLR